VSPVTSRPGPDAVRAAYERCEQITGSQAKNFSYGIKLLPAAKRQALSAVYAFARRVDDICDGDLPAEQKVTELAEARAVVLALAGPGADPGDDPVLIALHDAAGRFPIPLAAFGELVDGCEADVRGASYTTFSDLEWYCRCVAEPLADALGIALQLTNILRDIREDYGTGRVYLPAEDLKQFGTTLVAGGTELPSDDRLHEVIRFEADRARGWYATGLQLLPLLDPRSAASAGAMAGIYRRLLERISAQPAAVLQTRLSLTTREKAMVAVRSLAGMTRPATRMRQVMPS
jgi:phytoene synthase